MRQKSIKLFLNIFIRAKSNKNFRFTSKVLQAFVIFALN